MEWYLIETVSKREHVVKDRIERLVRQTAMEGVSEVLVPMQAKSTSKPRSQDTVAYPGYVFIQMDLNDENWNSIRHILDVKGFVSHEDPDAKGPTPAPLADAEMASYLEPISPGNAGWSFAIGDTVRIISGPMEDIIGQVSTIASTGKATVEINVFGRMTPVDVEASQLVKT